MTIPSKVTQHNDIEGHKTATCLILEMTNLRWSVDAVDLLALEDIVSYNLVHKIQCNSGETNMYCLQQTDIISRHHMVTHITRVLDTKARSIAFHNDISSRIVIVNCI